MLTFYYGNRHGSVANDVEYANRERAAENARARDRMQKELDAWNTLKKGETLDLGREDSSASPLPTTESTTHPRIPGCEHQVPINRPPRYSDDGESQREIILRSRLGVHQQPLNTHTIQVARKVTPFLDNVNSMHTVPIRDAQEP